MIVAQLARACYPFHPFGGLEQHVYQLTMELAKAGHIVHLYTQAADPGLPPADFKWPENVYHHFLPYQFIKLLRRNSIPDRLINYPVFSWRLAQQLSKLSPAPHIVHAHGLAAFGYAMQALPGVPLVLNPHGMEEFKNRSRAKHLAYAPFRGLLRYSAQQAAKVIATDYSLVKEVRQFLEVSDAKICLIPNAVDLDTLDQKLARAKKPAIFTENNPSLLLLSVGRLEENKGLSTGLLALKQLEMELPKDWRWVIVGEGTLAQMLKAQTAELGLTDNVIFTGRVSDQELYDYYRYADLFLQPTLYEGSSLTTLEAMACRLPVAASATGGLFDKIIESGENENGRLVPPGDAEILAQKLRQLLLHLSVQSRRRLGQNGRNLVEQSFQWHAAGKATIALYESLCPLSLSEYAFLNKPTTF